MVDFRARSTEEKRPSRDKCTNKPKSPFTFGNLQVEKYDEKKPSFLISSESLPLTNSELFIMCASFVAPLGPYMHVAMHFHLFIGLIYPIAQLTWPKKKKKTSIIFEFLQRRARSSTSKRSNASEIANQAKNKIVHVLVGCPTHDLLIYPRRRKL